MNLIEDWMVIDIKFPLTLSGRVNQIAVSAHNLRKQNKLSFNIENYVTQLLDEKIP